MNKKQAKYITIPFLLIIFGFFTLNIISPNKKYSVAENRNLEKAPTMQDIKNGDFASKFEKYYNDQFIFRDKFITLNKKTQINLNKTKVGSYYLVDDNWILGSYPVLLNEDKIEKYANTINELSKIATSIGSDVYFTMTPHKTNVLRHLYPSYVDNKENIDINTSNFKNKLSGSLTYIDMDEYLLNNYNTKELESFYFKTDHHWNGLGAFESFKMMAESMNLGVNKEVLESYFNKYKTLTIESKNFIGSYNRNLDMLVDEKEYPVYKYLEGSKYLYEINGKKKEEKDIIATQRYKEKWDYGGSYMRGSSCNILNIKNKKGLVNKKILIFRDSYQAPTTWLFADLFKEVEIIDPRNIEKINKTYKEMILESNPNIVMFMYNSSGFDSMVDEMIKKGIQ